MLPRFSNCILDLPDFSITFARPWLPLLVLRFLIETAAHLSALAHLCFTGSALVITLFIIVGATFFFFFIIETAGLLTTTTHSCFNGSVRLHSLLFTGFRNHVFNRDRLPYLRCGLIYVLMGPAYSGGVHLYTSSPCDSWVG
jgi:hypothetical protein